MKAPQRPLLDPAARIGILNRGEAALRFIRAVQEHNSLYATRLQSVAFFVEADEEAPFVEAADLAFPLASFLHSGQDPARPYLNRELMLRVLESRGCGGAWAGWGFLSEDAGFVRLLEERRLVFLGPCSRSMAVLGDKIAAKELAEKNGVPILPWSREPVAGPEQARAAAETIGYPCIIKAASAGGGRGIRTVREAQELAAQFHCAREEALRVTGEARLFIERLVGRARHLEVQVLADRFGNIQTLGVRDCSVQRRNQKIIEETPPAGLPEKLISDMEASAAVLIQAAAYDSAGTVEFLYDLDRNEYYFMEVNTRLQVEHPITEQAYDVDLVQGQIQVALGRKLEAGRPVRHLVAVEARLNAEDPETDFSPASGRVLRLRLPAGPGIRVDSGIEQGSLIPPEFDSMMAKIISFAPDRGQALARLERALRELQIKIEGGTSNRAFLIELLSRPEIRQGGVHTRFVEELLRSEPQLIRRDHWEVALIAAAVEQYRLSYQAELTNFKQQLVSGGYPRSIVVSEGQKVSLKAQGVGYDLLVRAVAPHHYHLAADGNVVSVEYLPRGQDALLQSAGRRYSIQTMKRGDCLQVEVNGVPYPIELEWGGIVRAPSPALVLSIQARCGEAVDKGTVLVVLEAMKMEMIVTAPEAGTLREVLVRPGEQVAAGQPLLALERDRSEEPVGSPESRKKATAKKAAETGKRRAAPPAPEDLLRSSTEESAPEVWRRLKQEYLSCFLGYDHDQPGSITLDKMLSLVEAFPEHREALARHLFAGVEIFVAVERLFSSPPVEAEQLTRPATYQELLSHYFRRQADREKGLPDSFVRSLRQALGWYLPAEASIEEQNDSLLRIYKSHAALESKQELLKASLFALQRLPLPPETRHSLSDRLDEVAYLSQLKHPSLSDAAIQTRYQLVDRALLAGLKTEKREKVDKIFALLDRHRGATGIYRRLMDNLVNTGHHVLFQLAGRALEGEQGERSAALEILARRFTRDRDYERGEPLRISDTLLYRCTSLRDRTRIATVIAVVKAAQLGALLESLRAALQDPKRLGLAEPPEVVVLLFDARRQEEELVARAKAVPLPLRWLCLGILSQEETERFHTFSSDAEGAWGEDEERRGFNPRTYRELRVYRLAEFRRRLLYSSEWVHLLHLQAKENPKDERLVALVEVPSARPQFDERNRIRRMVALEDAFMEAVYAMRAEQARRKRRLYWNRIVIHIHTVLNTTLEQNREYAARLATRTADLGLEKIVLYSRRSKAGGGGVEEVELLFENISGTTFTVRGRSPSEEPLRPMDDYVARVVRARQRGTLYPYEILKMITRSGVPVKQPFPRGEFEEFDIEVDSRTQEQQIRSVKGRPPGENTGNVVFGIVTNYPEFRPKGLSRVILLADPTTDMGSLSEKECRRLIAALDLAESRGLPVEWLPISAGARIEMDSGTENLDWTARVLRRIVSFTQASGEINIIVAGINIGAQSYWNAEATMLMHTSGLLIMTEEAAMLLTGKKALDFSGSVSAEDNIGIGGVARIMGPNGQAQARVRDLYEAYMTLFQHYELTSREPGKPFPPRAATSDPAERNAGLEPYQDNLGQGFSTIADIFSNDLNPERKKPFDMRQLMGAVVDRDSPVFERWTEMKDAEMAIIWEARIGGFPVGLIGIESRPLARIGEVPHDGPESWTGATLFPLSSKKIARSVNAFSGVLPLVVLANLSGFDGSPESLRKLQLEYGAEIGRAIVNFRGPIVFVVTARYHGGAYVVFSKALNENLRAAALEGAFASVIGGAPAAAVVFPSLVLKEANGDPRVAQARERLASGRAFYQKDFDELFQKVYAEKQNALARSFDKIHSVQRARQVGSIDDIISLEQLRPYLIESIERGMESCTER